MVEHVTKNNFDSMVKNSDIPVLLDFWAEWCGPCKMMGPVFEELSKDYEGKLRFAKLNVEEEPELAGQFQVQGIPTLMFLKDGEQKDKIVGFAPKDVLKSKIDAVLSKL